MSNLIKIPQPPIRAIKPEIIFMKGGMKFDASDYFLSGTTDNDIEDGVIGTASLNLAPIHNSKTNISTQAQIHYLKDKIKKYSLVSIKFDRGVNEYDFFGLVNHVFDSTSSDNNSTRNTLSVNCSLFLPALLSRDSLPKSEILVNDETIIKEFGKERSLFFKWTRGLYKGKDDKEKSIFTDNDPGKIIKWILQNTSAINNFKDVPSLKEDDNNSLYKLKDCTTDEPLLDIRTLYSDMLYDPSLSTFSGTIIDYIKACIDPNFYELFFETATYKGEDDKFYPANKMVVRTKPFSYKAQDKGKDLGEDWQYWENLPALQFNRHLCKDSNLGTNDFEVKNFFYTAMRNSLLFGQIEANGLIGAKFPVIDIESAKRYGFRELYTETKMIDTTQMGLIRDKETGELKKIEESELTENFYERLVKKRDRQVEWFSYPDFESGQLTAIGNSIYKVGRKLAFTDRKFYDPITKTELTGMEYYITHVTHSFDAEGDYSSSLSLTRGQPMQADYISKWLDENDKNLYKVPINRAEHILTDKIEELFANNIIIY